MAHFARPQPQQKNKVCKEGGPDAFTKGPAPRDHWSFIKTTFRLLPGPLRISAPCTGTGNAIRAAYGLFGEDMIIPMHMYDTDGGLEGQG